MSKKIKKLTPIDAIRNGQTGERFKKKSFISLNRTKANPTVYMAVNDILSAPKRFMTVIISFFVCTLFVLVLVNTVSTMKSSALVNLFSVEKPSHIYTATLAIYDKDDGLPVEGACVTVLNAGIGEIDPAYSDAEGVATIYLPAPVKGATDEYDVIITCYDFEDATAKIAVTYSADAKLGVPYETNCGAAVMKYTGEGKITGPHNVLIEKNLEIPVSTGYDGGSFSFPESTIIRAFGLDDDSYSAAVDAGEIVFVGVDVDGTEHASNTNGNGCWWGEDGYVKGWGSAARVFFEGSSYCSFTVGQYPGQVESGKTYPTCHKVSYKDEDGNTWEVVFKVNVTVV